MLMLNVSEIVLVFNDLAEVPDAVDNRTSWFDVTLTVKACPSDNFKANVDYSEDQNAPAICAIVSKVTAEKHKIVLVIQNMAACKRDVCKNKDDSSSESSTVATALNADAMYIDSRAGGVFSVVCIYKALEFFNRLLCNL